VAPEAWSWAALGGRGAVAARASLGGWRWGMELTAGPWPARDGFGLWGRRGQWTGWARGRVGRKVGRAKIKKKNFRIKNWIFEFTKPLEICRRFRWNFDMRIFPKFF
jgi:hypothetical protein